MIIIEKTKYGTREVVRDPGTVDGIPGESAAAYEARRAREEAARNARLLEAWQSTTGSHYVAGRNVGPKGKPVIDLATGKVYADARGLGASKGFAGTIPSGIYGALAAKSSWRGTWPAYLEPKYQDERRRLAELFRRQGLRP